MLRREKLWTILVSGALVLVGAGAVQAQTSHYGGLGAGPAPTQVPEIVAEDSAAASGGAEAERGAFFDENGEYNETFAKDFWDRGWEATTLIGNPNGDYFDLGPSRLSFKLPVTEVYEFVTHTGSLTEDVLVEATFENVRSTEASYGVVCRRNELGWYELRVNISGPLAGSYALYKYDTVLKASGHVPYVRLHPDMIQYFTTDLKLGMNVRNKIGLECKGGEIRVFINDKEQTISKSAPIVDTQFASGTVGAMAESYAKGVVDIDLVGFRATDLTE